MVLEYINKILAWGGEGRASAWLESGWRRVGTKRASSGS